MSLNGKSGITIHYMIELPDQARVFGTLRLPTPTDAGLSACQGLGYDAGHSIGKKIQSALRRQRSNQKIEEAAAASA